MIDYKLLKSLREKTGVSFSLCKRALEESDNDLVKAQKKLAQWGAKKAEEKSTRPTFQGGIFVYVHHNKKIAALVELRTETDFVAVNREFQQLGNEIAMQAASLPAKSVPELLKQEYIRDPEKSISDLIKEAIFKFGENIQIARCVRWELGEK